MGLTAHNIKYILKVARDHKIKGPVCTLGNQDIYATDKDIVKWVKEFNLPLKVPTTIIRSSSRALPTINKEAADYIHAKTFFEFLGIPKDQYYDIDKFDFDQPAIVADLQDPIEERFHDFFNLIIDGATVEHIFDVKAVLSNLVRMTKVGGYVLHLSPAQNYLNHGFYQFSPTLFYDFYTANGFEIVEAYIVETRGMIQRFYTYDQAQDCQGLYFDPGNRLGNCFLMRKISPITEITSPDQYYYRKLAQDRKEQESDSDKSLLEKLVDLGRRLVPFKFHGNFFKLWTLAKRLTDKRSYFDLKP